VNLCRSCSVLLKTLSTLIAWTTRRRSRRISLFSWRTSLRSLCLHMRTRRSELANHSTRCSVKPTSVTDLTTSAGERSQNRFTISRHTLTHSVGTLTAHTHSRRGNTHGTHSLTAWEHSRHTLTHGMGTLTADTHSRHGNTHGTHSLTAWEHSRHTHTRGMGTLTTHTHSRHGNTRQTLTPGCLQLWKT